MKQGIAHIEGNLAFMSDEIAAFTHAMNQKIDGVHTLQQGRKPGGPVEIDVMTTDTRQRQLL
ncbi:hypothetical protein D3C81_1939630 [compost metagenome]